MKFMYKTKTIIMNVRLSDDFEIDSLEDLLIEIHENSEVLLNEEGDEVEYISIKNLDTILSQFIKENKNNL
jgi:hypothetical protein